ncbi:MAG: hypothetical protein ACE5K7_06215 [Phycisphaerae bacterium]
MKHGKKLYARQVKRVFNRLIKQDGRPKHPGLTDPVEQLLLGVLARGTTEARAREALNRFKRSMVDYNELRVASPKELVELLGRDFPQAEQKAKDINKLLNAIFDRQHCLDLTFLRNKTRREARQYLASLDGVDPHTVASVMLLSIGGHAVPVDDKMLAMMRRDGLVEPSADVQEVQAFLERNIAAADAYAFYTLMRRYAARAVRELDASAIAVSQSDSAQQDQPARGSAKRARTARSPAK